MKGLLNVHDTPGQQNKCAGGPSHKTHQGSDLRSEVYLSPSSNGFSGPDWVCAIWGRVNAMLLLGY